MSKKVSMTEVAKHKTDKDCWVVIKGNAYDVTKFLPDHPGGKKAILMYAGKGTRRCRGLRGGAGTRLTIRETPRPNSRCTFAPVDLGRGAARRRGED